MKWTFSSTQLLKLHQEKRENVYKLLANKIIESAIKNFSGKKSQDQMDLLVIPTKCLRKN